ncbi:MAG: hypothetical protein IAC54_07780 [Bacteroidetes bacterium]|uniref:Uncharacterized protein n=1 Tax=Candidatus Caccoplasma merdipullorum TaxID=2840718 RepID=A0A9D9E5H9_9BACT|nr:hypothetical protein [Candidatus Caccoplasma merdipullorum]
MGIFAVLLFIILPVAVAVIFFIAAADINKIKKLKMENDALLLSRLERIEKSIEEIRKLANIEFTPPAPAVSSVREKALPDEGWADDVTESEKSEASVLIPRLADMQGVVIKCNDSGGYDVWSKYSWERFGNMDPGYRLIYKNYKE